LGLPFQCTPQLLVSHGRSKALRSRFLRVQCGVLTKGVAWSGTDPAPERLTTSASLRNASKVSMGLLCFNVAKHNST